MIQKDSRFGTIFKREALLTSTVNHGTNALILQAKDPFPGYYCSEKDPSDSRCKEQSFYLPVYSSSLPSDDQLCRYCLNARTRYKILSCPARFSLNGRTVQGIRLRKVEPGLFKELVQYFEELGLQFYSEKKIGTFLSHIYLKVFFNVKLISDDIYQNTENHDLYYLIIHESIEWSDFERLFTYQKSKTEFKNYDAAIGYWFTQPLFTDFIRIYGKNLSAASLSDIREEFLRNLKAYKESKIMI